MEKAFDLTDPATELAELAVQLRSAKTTQNGFSAIAGILKVDPNDLVYLELLTIMRQRIAFVENSILEFAELDDQLAEETKRATRACAELLSATRLVGPWDAKALPVKDTHISGLRWFGGMLMRKHYPRAVITPEQRDDVLSKVREELEALRTGEDFGWQRTALIEGLEKIERVLTYFPFFGHDAALKEFFAVDLELRAIYEQEPRQPENSTTLQKIFNTLTIIATLTTLYVMPDQIATANDRYRNWLPKVILSQPQLSPPAQKLLPAPEAIIPDEPKVEGPTERAAE